MRHMFYFVADENSPYCENGLLLDITKRKSKAKNPYAYDSFFLLGDHESIEGCSPTHTDRYKQWGQEKLDAARKASGTNHIYWDCLTLAELDRFVKAYHGEEYVATGLVENCNFSNGNPYWSIYFKKEE